MKRAIGVVVVLVAVSAAAGVGWLAGRNVKSPAQVAFEAEPPAPSLITVEVELTELAADVITRADVGYDDPAALSLGGALGGLPSVLIVTSAPERGDELGEGSVAIEISGRPVFLLLGEIPVFRDLRPQAVGPDVLQVEQGLARLGYLTEAPDDTWTTTTEVAVTAMYAAAGYEVNGVSDAEENQLEATRNAVKAAEDRVATAVDRLASAEDQLESAIRQRGSAQDDLEQAEERLAEEREGADELAVQWARSAVVSAEEQLGFAEADAESTTAESELSILRVESDRERAARDYTVAESRWVSVQTGVHPDSGNVPTALQMENLRIAVETAATALEAAERAISDAYDSRDRRAIQANAAVRSAVDQLAAARDALDELLTPPDTSNQERAVDSARSALDAAESGVERARSEVEDATSSIGDAAADLAAARDDLAELEAETGAWIPAGELIFLERLPVRVDLLTAERGSRVSGAFMTVTGSELAVRGSVLDRDVSLVKEDGQAWIDDSLLAEPLAATIRLVEDRPGTRDVANDRYYIELVADGIPDDLIGSNVRVVIPVGGTEGEVLAVPAAALSATADGSTRVEVVDAEGDTRFVGVAPGLAASGLVEITPLDGEIAPGDLVVVGVAAGE